MKCKVLGHPGASREEADSPRTLRFDENGETKGFDQVELSKRRVEEWWLKSSD